MAQVPQFQGLVKLDARISMAVSVVYNNIRLSSISNQS